MIGRLDRRSRGQPAIAVAAAVVLFAASLAHAADPAAAVTVPTADPPPPPSSSEFAARPANQAPPASASGPSASAGTTEWATIPIEEVRARANANDATAMEELARRLIQGTGVAKDPQAGAGWLLRAAEAGSPQAAFNVGVMYERGFVVERDSSRAVEWYCKAADGNMPAAKHNLALLLRDGKGAPRDVKRAVELLQSAARQGMAASMFSLGDIYERGDAGSTDNAAALAWFAIAGDFERQINHGENTALAKTAEQRAQALQRILTPAELKRAQQVGQAEYRAIVEALAPPRPDAGASAPAPTQLSPVDLPSWPKDAAEQVRVIQQALVELTLLRDKPDGLLGPLTRSAIRDFQRSNGLTETGDPSKELYVALRQAQAKRAVEASSPLPMPAKQDSADAPKPGGN